DRRRAEHAHANLDWDVPLESAVLDWRRHSLAGRYLDLLPHVRRSAHRPRIAQEEESRAGGSPSTAPDLRRFAATRAPVFRRPHFMAAVLYADAHAHSQYRPRDHLLGNHPGHDRLRAHQRAL